MNCHPSLRKDINGFEWIKVKNPAHPAIERAMLIAWSKRR